MYMIDFVNFIQSLENVKKGLEEAQKEINFSESAKNGASQISEVLEKSLETRKEIRNLFFECAREDQTEKLTKALKDFGEGIQEAKSLQENFEDFVASFSSELFEKLVCTEEIHKALHKMNATQQENLIDKVAEKWPELVSPVSKQIFIFSDIKNLDDRAVQKILREVDTQSLSKALINADKEVQDKIFGNMSERAAKMLQEDMEYMGPVREQDIAEDRNAICEVVMRLYEAGEIVF